MHKITLTPKQLTALLDDSTDDIEVEGFEGWEADAEIDSGRFLSEKGAMEDYEIFLYSPEGHTYKATAGYYNSMRGHQFDDDIEFELIQSTYDVSDIITEQEAESMAIDQFDKLVGDDGLFPNHTDKDIWISGFKSGVMWLNQKP